MNDADEARHADVFLAACAALLTDEAVGLDAAAGRIGDLMLRAGCADPELIVRLQDFDRLKQTLDAIGGALSHYAQADHATAGDLTLRADRARAAIGTISVAALRDRLLGRLAPDVLRADAIGTDVVF